MDDTIVKVLATILYPKTAKSKFPSQHIVLGQLAGEFSEFCPVKAYLQCCKLRLPNQITLFARGDGLPFAESSFSKMWRKFFDEFCPTVNLNPSDYSFYSFRSSALVCFSVDLNMSREQIKDISRHTELSKVLDRYLAKDKLLKKLKTASLMTNHSKPILDVVLETHDALNCF